MQNKIHILAFLCNIDYTSLVIVLVSTKLIFLGVNLGEKESIKWL